MANLVPVDDDPFAPPAQNGNNLKPVDFDPFADTPPKGNASGPATAFGEGLASGVPFGQRITSGLGALGASAMGAGNVSDLYNQAQADTEATAAANPKSSMAGAITGSIGSLPLIPTAAKWVKGAGVAPEASLISKFGNQLAQGARGAAVTAPVMAAYNAGDAKTIEDMPAAAGKGAVTGAVLGAATPLAFNAIGGAFGFGKKMLTSPADSIASMMEKPDFVTGEQLKDLTTNRYNTAKSLGIDANTDGTAHIIDTAADLAKTSKGEASTRGSPGTLQGVVDRWNKDLRGGNLSLEDIDGMSKGLADKIETKPNGELTNDGRKVFAAQQKLREMMQNPDPSHFNGGTEAFQELQKASKTAGIGFKISDIQKILQDSADANQPEQYMKQRFRNILKGPGNKFYPKDEQDLMRQIVNSDFKDEAMRGLGNRGLPLLIAATTGSVPEAALAALSGMGNRNAAFGARLSKVYDLTKAITDKLPEFEAGHGLTEAQQAGYDLVAPKRLALPPPNRAQTVANKAAKAAAGSNTGNVIHGAAPLTSDAERFATPPPNYEAPRPVEPKMLPSPTMINPSERQVTPWGSAHPAPYSNQSLRQGAAEVGLTPDVARAQKAAQETNLMQRFAQQKAAEKAAQEAAVWSAKGPEDIKALIDRGMANQQDLSEALGEGFNRNDMTEALLRARQGKSTGGIIKRFKKKQPK